MMDGDDEEEVGKEETVEMTRMMMKMDVADGY